MSKHDELKKLAERCISLSTIADAYSEEAYSRAGAAILELLAVNAELLKAAKSVIAWYESEDDHSKADFYERLQMCRDSESECRAAIARAEGESK